MAGTPIRCPLFVPATRPERIPKALSSAADVVIVDLEDAVAMGAKPAARKALARFIAATPEARLYLRINSADSGEQAADLALCAEAPGIIGLMIPKAESASALAAVAAIGKPLWPLIETPAGVLGLADLCRVDHVERLAFGALDYAAATGLAPQSAGGRDMLDYARYQLLTHSCAAGLAPPLDSVFPDLHDEDGLKRSAERARDMGFGGMLCIHPAQTAAVRAAFRPSAHDIDWARRVIEGAQHHATGAFQVDGQMVDAPVLARARRILTTA